MGNASWEDRLGFFRVSVAMLKFYTIPIVRRNPSWPYLATNQTTTATNPSTRTRQPTENQRAPGRSSSDQAIPNRLKIGSRT